MKQKIWKGTISYLSGNGYGFIRPIDAPKRVGIYFHVSAIKHSGQRFEDVLVGDSVTYTEVIKTERGQIAKKVFIYG